MKYHFRYDVKFKFESEEKSIEDFVNVVKCSFNAPVSEDVKFSEDYIGENKIRAFFSYREVAATVDFDFSSNEETIELIISSSYLSDLKFSAKRARNKLRSDIQFMNLRY